MKTYEYKAVSIVDICEKGNEFSGFINYGEISWQAKQRSSA
jgi:hypothetical protein